MNFMLHLCASIIASIFLAILVGCASEPTPKPSKTDRTVYSYTLAEKKLLYIVEQQNRFFERIKSKSRMSHSDALSIKSRIDSLWDEYLAQFPNDANALIINGKFLRATGDEEASYKHFSAADRINPNLAVVKQQLANYEAEHGLPREAYKNLKRAIELEPNVAIYRVQLADLLLFYRDEFTDKKFLEQNVIDDEMINSMEKAAELEPNNSRINWKYARFFYDINKPNWNVALKQWNVVLEKFAPLNLDKQTALANKARVLIELNRDNEAETILKTIDLKALSSDAKKLMSIIEETKKQKNKNGPTFTN